MEHLLLPIYLSVSCERSNLSQLNQFVSLLADAVGKTTNPSNLVGHQMDARTHLHFNLLCIEPVT